MAITFLQMAQKVLQEEKQPLSTSEIWQVAVSKGYEKLLDLKGITPWATLGALIYVDVRDNPSSAFVPIGARPKRFILKSQMDILGGKASRYNEDPPASNQETGIS